MEGRNKIRNESSARKREEIWNIPIVGIGQLGVRSERFGDSVKERMLLQARRKEGSQPWRSPSARRE